MLPARSARGEEVLAAGPQILVRMILKLLIITTTIIISLRGLVEMRCTLQFSWKVGFSPLKNVNVLLS